MMEYCEACGKDVNTRIITRKESFNVCGEDITVDAQVLVCSECGEELFCEELDSKTLIDAYNEYRRKHKLLFPKEIQSIREQYGLSQRSFAKLLNWGDKTICRYENGSIQDKAHNSLLLFLRNPENMRTYLTENEVMFDENQRIKLLATVEKLQENVNVYDHISCLNPLFSEIPCVENGFKGFDYEKVRAMVLFFAHKNTELLKTKLMKLMNYSDMVFFKENGVSISGLKYAHLQYGPVPENFEVLLWKMSRDHVVHIEVLYDNIYEKHQVVPDCEIPKDVLTIDEMRVLERINSKFADYGSKEISKYSHKEKGYCETKQGELIPYSYAKDMQV